MKTIIICVRRLLSLGLVITLGNIHFRIFLTQVFFCDYLLLWLFKNFYRNMILLSLVLDKM